jgi:condensin complex subunit 2
MNRTEMSWFKASAGMDASSKIYGFRVDQVHSETYKVHGGLHRSDNR